jgi:hypothetical protein
MASVIAEAACMPKACYVITFDVVECTNVEVRGRMVADLSIKATDIREAACFPSALPITTDALRQPPSSSDKFRIPFWLGTDTACSTLARTMHKFWYPKCCDIVGQMQECASAPHTLEEVPPWAK